MAKKRGRKKGTKNKPKDKGATEKTSKTRKSHLETNDRRKVKKFKYIYNSYLNGQSYSNLDLKHPILKPGSLMPQNISMLVNFISSKLQKVNLYFKQFLTTKIWKDFDPVHR